MTEEQAEEIIAYAEEAAERVEEETRLAREAPPMLDSESAPAPAASPETTAKQAFENLFGGTTPAAGTERQAEAVSLESAEASAQPVQVSEATRPRTLGTKRNGGWAEKGRPDKRGRATQKSFSSISPRIVSSLAT